MDSAVYFADARARSDRENKITKVQKLFDAAGLGGLIGKGNLVAVKVHFGEVGTDAFISPVLVRQVVDKIKSLGGRPFVTDTSTLYGGGRSNSVDHIQTAISHGFDYSVLGAPVIIADGLKSRSYAQIDISKNHFKSVKIARDIVDADCMIVLSHFKGHLLSGFGGAIKNLGMGCSPALGKSEQHSAKPIFKPELCVGCKECTRVCPNSAVTVEAKISNIDYNACAGCGECLRVCPAHAIDLDWAVQIPPFMERMAEYAYGAVQAKRGKIGFINFLLNITPDCDCLPWSDSAFVQDIGILASLDPVAIDHASYDLVNKEQGFSNSLLQSNLGPGEDKFKGIWSYTDGVHQIDYGEKIGLGNKGYRLVKV